MYGVAQPALCSNGSFSPGFPGRAMGRRCAGASAAEILNACATDRPTAKGGTPDTVKAERNPVMFSGEGNKLVRSEFDGVAGCPAGWVSIETRCSGEREMEFEPPVFPRFEVLPEKPMAAEFVIVNIPSALPEGSECDREARKEPGQRLRPGVFQRPTTCTARETAEPPRSGTPTGRSTRLCRLVGTMRLRYSGRSSQGLLVGFRPR